MQQFMSWCLMCPLLPISLCCRPPLHLFFFPASPLWPLTTFEGSLGAILGEMGQISKYAHRFAVCSSRILHELLQTLFLKSPEQPWYYMYGNQIPKQLFYHWWTWVTPLALKQTACAAGSGSRTFSWTQLKNKEQHIPVVQVRYFLAKLWLGQVHIYRPQG